MVVSVLGQSLRCYRVSTRLADTLSRRFAQAPRSRPKANSDLFFVYRTSRRRQDYPRLRCTFYTSSILPQFLALTANLQGKDATEEFEPIHPPDTLDKYLDKSKHLGPVDMDTVEKEEKEEDDPEEIERQARVAQKPLLSQCYNLLDFEAVARRVMKKTAWGYYSSAADDEIVRVLLLLTIPKIQPETN